MKKIMIVVFLAVCAVGHSQDYKKLNVKALYKIKFFNKSSGYAIQKNVYGWKSMSMSGNGQGLYHNIVFTPKVPFRTEAQAIKIVQEKLGIKLSKRKEILTLVRFGSANEHTKQVLNPKIKIVNLWFVDPRNDKRIKEIYIGFNISWDEK